MRNWTRLLQNYLNLNWHFQIAQCTREVNALSGLKIVTTEFEGDMRLLSAPDEVRRWSKQFYGRELPLCEIVTDRYPLLIFAGDVGTGKTATAEAACDRLSRESGRDSMLFKLSTRVRGTGKVGQMSSLINQAFEIITKEAGKAKAAFLIIDEADSLSATRDAGQSHHEHKVGVNTIIQKVDDLRRLGGRVLVILCTNRGHVLDPAIVRRAARIERFERPNAAEREKLIRLDYEGLGLTENIVKELVDLTGPQKGANKARFHILGSADAVASGGFRVCFSR